MRGAILHLFRQVLAVVFILSLPLLVGFGPPKLVESDSQRVPIYGSQLPSIKNDVPPSVEARASMIMDASTGRVVYQKNGTKRLAPASITKIMTAIVALEHGNPKDKVTISPDFMTEGSTMGLTPGDVVTLEDLLWGMMLPSGNDAATAIAGHVGGSAPTFVAMMNEKADELSLANTHFVNPHGLDDEGHYSSALDIARMSRYALSNPKFSEIVGTRFREVNASRDFLLVNNNHLLENFDLSAQVDGIKTGFTDNAGDSITASAVRDGRRIIAVAMGTYGRDRAAASLIDYAFSSFGWINIESPFSKYVGNIQSLGQESNNTVSSMMLPRWQNPYTALYVTAEQASPLFLSSREAMRRDNVEASTGMGPASKRNIRPGG